MDLTPGAVVKRGILIGLLLGALLFAAAAVGGKVVNVTNPMTVDLDAGGASINHAEIVQAVAFDAIDRFGTDTVASLGAGRTDPTVAPCDSAPIGSLFLRNSGTAGELWFHPSISPCDWIKLAP